MPIINGRRVTDVPPQGVRGEDLIRELNPGPGRRSVFRRGGFSFETIRRDRQYRPDEMTDRHNRPVPVTTIPDRTKGGFGGRRDPLSKRIITEQVMDVATHLFKQGVDFDEDDAHWMVVPKYYLPRRWHHIARSSPLLITFPEEYPTLPPVGFYLTEALPASANGHLYTQAYHQAWKAPLEQGWKWYCVYVEAGAWRPAPVRYAGDWKRGDNLWTYVTLINEVLASGD